jgi:hypothetical protein
VEGGVNIRNLIIAALVCLLAALGACNGTVGVAQSTFSSAPTNESPTPLPSGGLTEDEAVAAAKEFVNSTTPAQVTDSHAGDWESLRAGSTFAHDGWVWAITFSGTFSFRCPAAPPDASPYNCPDEVSGHEEVVIDYYTGEGLLRRMLDRQAVK